MSDVVRGLKKALSVSRETNRKFKQKIKKLEKELETMSEINRIGRKYYLKKGEYEQILPTLNQHLGEWEIHFSPSPFVERHNVNAREEHKVNAILIVYDIWAEWSRYSDAFPIPSGGIHYDRDNPILNLPGSGRLLTHYILSKQTQQIIGKIYYLSHPNRYEGVFFDREKTISINNQTSYLDQEQIEWMEEDDSRDYYLYPIRISWIDTNLDKVDGFFFHG